MSLKQLVVVIPAYNESSMIARVVKSLPKKITGFNQVRCVVVDDGSTDRTLDCALGAGATVVRHRVNLGVGGATATGFGVAQRLKADAMVTLDGDGQHSPDDIEKLIQPIVQDKADVVIGARQFDYAQMPWLRVFGNYIFNGITYLFYGVRTNDSQSGFRAYNKQAIQAISIKTLGYEVCTELFGEAKAKGLRTTEVPIQTIYNDHSKIKGQPAINGVNIIFKLVSRFFVGSL